MLPLLLYLSTGLVFLLNFVMCCAIMIKINQCNPECCFFSSHSLVIASLNMLTCVYYVITSPYSILCLTMPAEIYWGLAVFLGLSRHLSMISFAASRIVSLTFTRRQQQVVWSAHVYMFCLLVTFLLPLGLVASFVIDNPQIHVERDGSIAWGVPQIRNFYLISGYAIYGISITLCSLGLISAIVRTKYPGCFGLVHRRMSNGELSVDSLHDDIDDFSEEHNVPYAVVAVILLAVHTGEFVVGKEIALRYEALPCLLTLATSATLPLSLLAFWRWTTMQDQLMYSSAPFYRGVRYCRKRLRALFSRRRPTEMDTPISFIYNAHHQRVAAMVPSPLS